MQSTIKYIEKIEKWALFNTDNLRQITPWLDTPAKATAFADKHANGWREEDNLSVIDAESYKRIRFHKVEVPRMMEKKMKLQQSPRTINDLVVFHPVKTEVKRASGESQIDYVTPA
jgi:hypothetical protein